MRFYIFIFFSAILLIGLAFSVAENLLPSFTFSREFWKSIYVESLSFIFTAAVIGSVSAMLLHYLQERELKPMRRYVAQRVAQGILNIVVSLREIMSYGTVNPIVYDKLYIASGEPRLNVYQRHRHLDKLYMALGQYERSRDDITELISRYAGSFPAASQDDLLNIEQHFEYIDRVLSVVKMHLPQWPNSTVEIGVKSMNEALQILGFDKLQSSETEFVNLSINLDPPSSYTILSDGKPNRAVWAKFFTAVKTVFGPYDKQAADRENTCRAQIESLQDFQLFCIRIVLYLEDPRPNSIGIEYKHLRGDVDFDAEAEIEERIMARVPKGLISARDGLFDAEGLAKTLQLDVLKKIEPYVKEEHIKGFTDLVREASRN